MRRLQPVIYAMLGAFVLALVLVLTGVIPLQRKAEPPQAKDEKKAEPQPNPYPSHIVYVRS